jgi:antitoxin component of MazEF toxin-antitoxin module
LRNRTPKTWENSSTTSYACDHAARLLPILHSDSGGTQTQINYVLNATGNSQGLMFHATLMNLAHMKIGNQVNMEIHEGGTIRLTPLRLKPSCKEVSRVIQATM